VTIIELEQTENWRKGDWMQTFSGNKFYPLNPRPQDIAPQDIAHALSLLCRFNGHVDRFYSVAEHCLLLSHYVSEENALWALLHDATEAYVGDMVRPLKRSMPAYVEVEDRVMDAIRERFDLPLGMPREVHQADSRILLNERNTLMPNTKHKWQVEDLDPLEDTVVRGLPPKTIESMYLDRLNELLEKR
jgi:hypothetical protein